VLKRLSFGITLILLTLLASCLAENRLLPESVPTISGTLTATLPVELPPQPSTTPNPVHPLSIQALRERTYSGSDFIIEQVLTPGINYNRYVVSYLSDGLKIYALMTIPTDPKPPTGFPVIIFNHGYIPPTQYRTTERYIAYVDMFASNGYIVIKSDYRGHGISEGQPESAYGSPAYVIDVLNALASARRHPDADPNRIGMWGHSMGGYITLRAMVVDSGIKAGVIWAGVVASYPDLFQSWFGRGGSSRRGSWRDSLVEEYGTPEENPAFWNSLSANHYLADLSGPIQLHHGTGDTSVPYEYSVTLDEQIRAVGGKSELILYSNDDHNISYNLSTALVVSLVFFDAYVKGLD
jgi:dipeptidyl aminopeptidase/acylaminoacyl peptidase